MGRMLGLELLRQGWQVTLYDKSSSGLDSCTWVGAGMLAPSCELETAESTIALFGEASLARWPSILESLATPVYMVQRGSLVVAHPGDRAELDRFRGRVSSKRDADTCMQTVGAEQIAELEPGLETRFSEGLYLPREAHLDNRELLNAMEASLLAEGAALKTGRVVTKVGPRRIHFADSVAEFDVAFDCRGTGASDDLKDLRGVRGELVYLEAPEVKLSRPVRLMHPRYPIYIVPRQDDVYVVGATAIESEDYSHITVRSALELLSAAYTVHPGFAEGHLLEAATQCRPAFPDNLPRLTHAPGLMRINGLYRHGFLISPKLAEFGCAFAEQGCVPDEAACIAREEAV